MIMANREFLKNRNIDERNSLPDLMQNISPDSEEEINFIDHSIYYTDQDYKECISRSKGALRMLNLNCAGLNAKFDNLKIFLAECNNNLLPLHVITLQETHINSNADVQYFELPAYTLVYDLARINSFGGVAIYVHDSFSFTRLDIDKFKQDSSVYESMYLEIYNKDASFHKYVIGSVYRRPSDLLDDLTQFNEEFSVTLSNIHAVSRQAYVNGDYDIDLLQLHTNTHYNACYENITAQGFFPKITRPTRSFGNSHKLIDNVLTNNLCKQHTSGILHRKKLFVKSKRNPSQINIQIYKEFKNKNLTNQRIAERNYFQKQFDLQDRNMGTTFKVIRTLLDKDAGNNVSKSIDFVVNNTMTCDPKQISNSFNNYFISVGSTLASNIHSNVNPLLYVDSNINSIIMPEVTEEEITLVILSINNSAPGYDDMPASVMKKCVHDYITPLTYLVNSSIKQGIFPSELKIAKVFPIFKAGDEQLITNYRPISVLNFFSKIFEKVVANYIVDFLESNTKRKNTNMALEKATLLIML